MKAKKMLIKFFSYPVYLLLKGKFSVYRLLSQYGKYESLEKDDLDIIRKKRLDNAIKYAQVNIPYYNSLFDRLNLKFSENSIFDDIKKVPFLTKEIIKENFADLINPSIKSYIKNSSGGSTGEPVNFLQDLEFETALTAATIYLDGLAGYKIGDTVIMLWGSGSDISKASQGVVKKLSSIYVHNNYFLNSFIMDDKIMERYVEAINYIKPDVIVAYAESANEISKYILEKKLKVYNPKAIITSAGVLTQETKVIIEKAFNCKVINRYGSREVGNIACQCRKQKYMHSDFLNKYLEIVNEQGMNCAENAEGEIIITEIANKVMPLIRYKIGDIGSYYPYHKCECGLSGPVLIDVKGRTSDVFKMRNGRRISGTFLTTFLNFIQSGEKSKIKRFRIIQKDYEHIQFLYSVVGEDDVSDGLKEIMGDKLKQLLGNEIVVEIIRTTDFMPNKSGKFLYIISEI